MSPINSLWIWGGGQAPAADADMLPPLIADDALLNGYWASKEGLAAPWPGDFAGCRDVTDAGFVAITPDVGDSESLEYWLYELKGSLKDGSLSSLTLLFRDGVVARIRRSHAVRIWRKNHSLLEPTGDRA